MKYHVSRFSHIETKISFEISLRLAKLLELTWKYLNRKLVFQLLN